MKKSKKKLVGKNKFVRLDEANLKFVKMKAKQLDRSENWVINYAIGALRSSTDVISHGQ